LVRFLVAENLATAGVWKEELDAENSVLFGTEKSTSDSEPSTDRNLVLVNMCNQGSPLVESKVGGEVG
jgi:hypothetical protein